MGSHIHHICLLLCIMLFLTQNIGPSMAYLSTSGRWIVNERGDRVKLACANWPAHLQPVVAEGLSKQPAAAIANKIKEMGFNCVRLTWPLVLATDDNLANRVTVRQSFQNLGLNDDINGLQQHNPQIIDLPLIEALKSVVRVLGDNGVMVVLDNHLTIPGWCCGYDDGNGFFGDKFFNPEEWVSGWRKMAGIFNGVNNVVAMSLRNELRGRRQNVNDWFNYMQQGAEAIHSANPNVVVIFSGFDFATDLSFVKERGVSLSFKKKLVFELHWYSWYGNLPWGSSNANDVCGSFLEKVKGLAGFLLDQNLPLFVSEYGMNEAGSLPENRYFSCLSSWLAKNDLDSSIWGLQGSYYLRDGARDTEELYGVLAKDWINVRNPSFLQKLSLVQSTLDGPKRGLFYSIIFHPLTGLCLVKKSGRDSSFELGQCRYTARWSYEPHNYYMKELGHPFCLKSYGAGQAVKLDKDCSSPGTQWKHLSKSQLHMASTPTGSSAQLCLDVDGSNNVVSNPCKCLAGDASCDPTSQWFKVVRASRKL